MDISVAASMFDTQPVKDGYTGEVLFSGQPIPYDGSVRDSIASWRQSLAAREIVTPPRGVVSFGDEIFIAGKVVQDFFYGEVIRENVVLHPCDDLYQHAPAAEFLASTVTVPTFYGGVAWRKTSKDEKDSPEYHNICDIYLSPTEATPKRDHMILSGSGVLYRVRSVEVREGGFVVAVCSDLGKTRIQDIAYTSKGVYDPVSDAMSVSAPLTIKGILELTQTNYKYVVAATAKYEPGDRVITVRVVDVPQPNPDDLLVATGVEYKVISSQLDDAGSSWEIHCRRV